MKVITAFDSFKGCMTASEACLAAERGVMLAHPEALVVNLPMSDGGEGLVECIAQVLSVRKKTLSVCGPLKETVYATYAISRDGTTAYMEMAAAAGLSLVPAQRRNPILTTTYGVGQLLLDAREEGCRTIIIGLGGSATCDGGVGMLECLRDHHCAQPDDWRDCTIIIAADVCNPLCGPLGAARVFAPQKGAAPADVELLEQRLLRFAQETADAGIAPLELMNKPAAGAAGGLGYGLMAYTGATPQSGIKLMLDIMHFDEQIADADLVITGEGKSEEQTLMGKVPSGVLERARQFHVPCHLRSGVIEDAEMLLAAGFASVDSIHAGDSRPTSVLLRQDVSEQNISRSVCRLLSNFS